VPPLKTSLEAFKSPSRLTALLICLQILGYPLAPSFAELVGIPNAILSYPIRFAVFFLALIQLPHALRFWKSTSQFMRQCIGAYALFWFVFYSRVLYDLFVREVANTANLSVYIFFPFLVSGIPTLALFQLIKENQTKFIREYFTYAGLICTSLFIVNIVKLSPEAKAIKLLEGRFGLENLNPISAGYVGSVACLAAISFSIHEFTKENPVRSRQILGVFCALMGLSMVLLAASRAPLVACFLGIVILLFAEARVEDQIVKRKRLTLLLGIAMGVFLLVALSGAQLLFGLNPFGRFETAFGDDPINKNSGTHRLMIGQIALEHFFSNPLIGSSAFVNSLEVYPHNMLLEALMVGGSMAAIPFLFLSFVGIFGWLKLYLSGKSPLLVAVSFIYAIASSNSGAIAENTESWGVIAVMVGYAVGLPVPQQWRTKSARAKTFPSSSPPTLSADEG
jgi:hypothetical protein